MRHCLVGRFANFLRHVPPDVISEAAKEFDDEIRDTLFAVLKQPDLSAAEKERAWRAASLPLRHGGPRLQSAQEIAPLAFFFCGQRGSAPRPHRVPRGTCRCVARPRFERDSPPPDPGIVDYVEVHRAVHWGFNWVNDLDAGQEQAVPSARGTQSNSLARPRTSTTATASSNARSPSNTSANRRHVSCETCRAAQRCGKRIQRAVYCRP